MNCSSSLLSIWLDDELSPSIESRHRKVSKVEGCVPRDLGSEKEVSETGRTSAGAELVSVTADKIQTPTGRSARAASSGKTEETPYSRYTFSISFSSSLHTAHSSRSAGLVRCVHRSWTWVERLWADFWLLARWPAPPSGVFDPRTNPSRRTLPFASLKRTPYPRQKRSLRQLLLSSRVFSSAHGLSPLRTDSRSSRVTASSLLPVDSRHSPPPSSLPETLPRPWPSL